MRFIEIEYVLQEITDDNEEDALRRILLTIL